MHHVSPCSFVSVAEVFPKAKLSEAMSRIRGRSNKDTEGALAKLLRSRGITGWRRNQPVLGKPDFVFHHKCVAIFVDGCFWHGCPKHSHPAKWIRKSQMPATARSFDKLRMTTGSKRTGKRFWREKLAANIARDRFVSRELRKQGWRVIRIWEHQLRQGRGMRDEGGRMRVVEKIRKALGST